MKFSFHHTVRIRLCPKNEPAGIPERKPPDAALAGLFPVQTIYALLCLTFGKSQPPDCVPPREAVPDILHGSYLLFGAISRFIAYAFWALSAHALD